MAKPPQQFTLDRSIWNQDLYSHMRSFWFDGLKDGDILPPFSVVQRWWGINRSQDEKAAFDGECRESYGRALKAVGPDQLLLPPFESYENDIENAETISHPFLTEVKEAQEQDEKHGAAALLSVILLLDQMSRNIYRDPAGLRAVYTHYDRLALSLLYGSMRLDPSPVDHEAFSLKPAYNGWVLMPLMHAEHLPAHELWLKKMQGWQKEIEARHGPEFKEYAERGMEAAEKHLEPLQQFGRYPHRNEAMGRENTREEEAYLKTADTFGVQQQQKQSDTNAHEKSEL